MYFSTHEVMVVDELSAPRDKTCVFKGILIAIFIPCMEEDDLWDRKHNNVCRPLMNLRYMHKELRVFVLIKALHECMHIYTHKHAYAAGYLIFSFASKLRMFYIRSNKLNARIRSICLLLWIYRYLLLLWGA